MFIPSSEIPQADKIDDVVEVIFAVNKGASTDYDIGRYFEKVPRQGRYYRLAAQLLGLVKNYQNHSELTKTGEKMLNISSENRLKLLREAVLNTKLFQRVIPFLELHPEGISKEQLEKFIKEATERVGPSMIPRRTSTVISWLSAIDLMVEKNKKYYLARNIFQHLPVTKFKDLAEPILPLSGQLREYHNVERRFKEAAKDIQVNINMVAKERANIAHIDLINTVANQIRNIGSMPRENQLIDLATRFDNISYIFEMKSITDKNVRSQIRRGMSQLYEYRYLQNLNEAILVLVLEKDIPIRDEWMYEYLEKDRQIKVIWDGNKKLYANKETQQALSFLWK